MALNRKTLNFLITGVPEDLLPGGEYKIRAVHTHGKPAFEFLHESKEEELTGNCEHFLEASRIALEVLSELIPRVQVPDNELTVRMRLQVVEDILDSACARYTD